MANISDDPQFILDTTNKVLKIFDDWARKKINYQDDTEKKFMDILRKHIGMNGNVVSAEVNLKSVADVKAIMKERNIPYAAIPSANGKMLFISRDVDADRFQNVLYAVEQNNPGFAKRMTVSEIATNAEVLGESNAFTIEPNYNGNPTSALAEIIKVKLLDNNITASNTNEKIFMAGGTYPAFNEEGNDLCKFHLEMAVKNVISFKNEAFFENASAYNTIYAQQKIYDADVLKEFVNRAKNGESVVLAQVSDGTRPFISAVNGKIKYLDEANNFQKEIDINEFSAEEIITHLSNFSDGIYDKGVMSLSDFKENIYKKKPSADTIRKYCKRPIGDNPEFKEIKRTENALRNVFRQANKQATEEAIAMNASRTMTRLELKEIKEQRLLDILNKKEEKYIKEFLNGETGLLRSVDGFDDKLNDHLYDEAVKCYCDKNSNLYTLGSATLSEIRNFKEKTDVERNMQNEFRRFKAKELGFENAQSKMNKALGELNKAKEVYEKVSRGEVKSGKTRESVEKEYKDALYEIVERFPESKRPAVIKVIEHPTDKLSDFFRRQRNAESNSTIKKFIDDAKAIEDKYEENIQIIEAEATPDVDIEQARLEVEECQRLYEEATNEFEEIQLQLNDELKMYEAKENYNKANKAPEVEIDME